MQLFYAPTSPFARKVRILAREIGLEERIRLVHVNPWTDESLRAHNPLAQVPTLVADNGLAIYDSRVICVHLDRIARSGRVVEAPLHSLVLEALADGICDAAVRRVREGQRPEDDRHQDLIERQAQAMAAGLDEAERTLIAGPFDIGEIALVCALGYVDFRLPQDQWRRGRSKLTAWFEAMSARPSVAGTEPS